MEEGEGGGSSDDEGDKDSMLAAMFSGRGPRGAAGARKPKTQTRSNPALAEEEGEEEDEGRVARGGPLRLPSSGPRGSPGAKSGDPRQVLDPVGSMLEEAKAGAGEGVTGRTSEDK